jgi:hypothetical protein
VVSGLALFVALGGSGYAATQISGSDIANESISGKKLKHRTIGARKLKKNTLGSTEIDESRLGEVPKARAARAASDVVDPEPVRLVGRPGQPQFDPSCGNASAVGAEPERQPVGFYKDREGAVHLQGVYKCSTDEVLVFSLPAGYRPADGHVVSELALCVSGCASGVAAPINVHGSGTGLTAGAVTGVGTSMSFDGITFRAVR